MRRMVEGASFSRVLQLGGAGDADLGAAPAELAAQPEALGGVVGHHLRRDQACTRCLAADLVERVVGDGHAAIPAPA
jgi:hypothetical protein